MASLPGTPADPTDDYAGLVGKRVVTGRRNHIKHADGQSEETGIDWVGRIVGVDGQQWVWIELAEGGQTDFPAAWLYVAHGAVTLPLSGEEAETEYLGCMHVDRVYDRSGGCNVTPQPFTWEEVARAFQFVAWVGTGP
jgi:hypothetical protein